MDHTIHESQQLDLLFDHMLQSRLHANAMRGDPAVTADIPPSSSSDAASAMRPRHNASDSAEYADTSAYCKDTNTNWIGKHPSTI